MVGGGGAVRRRISRRRSQAAGGRPRSRELSDGPGAGTDGGHPRRPRFKSASKHRSGTLPPSGQVYRTSLQRNKILGCPTHGAREPANPGCAHLQLTAGQGGCLPLKASRCERMSPRVRMDGGGGQVWARRRHQTAGEGV